VTEIAVERRRAGQQARRPRQRRQHNLRSLAINFLVLSLVVCSGLMLAARNATLVSVGYQIEDFQKQLAALQEENRHLALEVAQLESAERIEAEARRLGMVQPGDPQVIAAATAIEDDVLSAEVQLAFADEADGEWGIAGFLSWARTAVAGFFSSPGQVEAGGTRP